MQGFAADSLFSAKFTRSRSSRARILLTSLPTSSSKSGPRPSVFNELYVTSSSRYCLVHILSTSSSKSAKCLSVFYDFYVKSSSRYSPVRILSTSSSKSGPGLSVFYGFYVTSSSRYSLMHILSTSSRIEARNRGNRDHPAATTDSHFTRKNAGFCAPGCFQPWIHTFPIAHTSQLLDGDVIDMMIQMMMWAPWWWDS